MPVAPATRLGQYEVVEPLGAGGMGEVYRARDTKLGRDVALKVLPPERMADPDRRRRFVQEAQATAALSNPHIGVVYDIVEAEGQTFIAMELIRGKPLSDHLRGDRPSLVRALELAGEIAEGLAHAHGKGILHRDLKPGNVMLGEDGHAKIIDFGLAKLVEADVVDPEAETAVRADTRAGAVLGTVAYMSPEQARAREVDQRSDIFSFGTLLYELVTGVRPFSGESHVETLNAIIHTPAPRLATDPGDGASEVQRILDKCLAKEPAERYQSMSDVVVDLKAARRLSESSDRLATIAHRAVAAPRWLVPAVLAAILIGGTTVAIRYIPPGGSMVSREPVVRSIAVLPLDNLSGDPSQDYFADGMTEALIADLSRISALRVISRKSVMRFKDSTLSLPEIARELGVDSVLEGSIQRDVDQVRITAQLIDVDTDRHLWVDTFEREIKGVLALQAEVSQAIASAIAVEIAPGQALAAGDAREVNPETFEAYLRGMHHLKKGTAEGIERGMAYLNEAVDADPADPLAYAGLAQGYVNMGHATGDAESFRRARAAAQRALELDPGSAEAQAVLADVAMFFDWDWDAAAAAFRRALELNPSHADIHAEYAWLFAVRGQWEDAIREAKLAQQLDPLGATFTHWLAQIYMIAGRHDDAITEFRKALELNPDSGNARSALGVALAKKGIFDEAIEQLSMGTEKAPAWKPDYGRVLVVAGRHEEARALLEELSGDPGYPVSPVTLATFQAAYGDIDGAIDSLEAGYEARDAWMPWIGSLFDPGPIVDDPRYQDLLRKMNLKYVAPTEEAGP